MSGRGDAIPQMFAAEVPWIGEIGRLALEHTPCILCGASDSRPVQRFVVNGEALFTVRCVRDGMMWLDPRPSAAFYERLYAETAGIWRPTKYPGELANMNVLGRRRPA